MGPACGNARRCQPLVMAFTIVVPFFSLCTSAAFNPSHSLCPRAFCHPSRLPYSSLRRRPPPLATACGDVSDSEEAEMMAVRSPLRWVGPYPALALRFPELATSAQQARGEKGVSLDFVLDTAANTNTINAAVAAELRLQQVGDVAGGTGAAGAIRGGATFMLGACELDDLSKDERFEFVSGLTASALPIASPAAAGLLGIAFLDSFPGGVEFCWGGNSTMLFVQNDVVFFHARILCRFSVRRSWGAAA